MRRAILIFAVAIFAIPVLAQSRTGPGYYNMRAMVIENDTVALVDMLPVTVFRKPADMRQYQRLVDNVKKVYPIAKEAKARLEVMEVELMKMTSSREQNRYVRQMEKEITRQYTPVLRRMTFSQGKILIKLIDRETSRSSFAIVRELRGGFSASLYQGIARIFGANLKDTYDKTGEDRMIEQIINLYEAGML